MYLVTLGALLSVGKIIAKNLRLTKRSFGYELEQPAMLSLPLQLFQCSKKLRIAAVMAHM